MPEAASTWPMARTARAQAAERAITVVEIANVLADPEVDVASAGDPRLRLVGRVGVYLVIAPEKQTIVGVDGQQRLSLDSTSLRTRR